MTMSRTATTATTTFLKEKDMNVVQHIPNEPSLINYEEECALGGTGESSSLTPSDELFCPISHTIMCEPVIAAGKFSVGFFHVIHTNSS